MTGVDNTPQARLTFEQQVSKDVTMTYITNLNYTAEQIVRLQWDLNAELVGHRGARRQRAVRDRFSIPQTVQIAQ